MALTIKPWKGRTEMAAELDAGIAEVRSRADAWDRAGDLTAKERKQLDESQAQLDAELAKVADLDRRRGQLAAKYNAGRHELWTPDGRSITPPEDPERTAMQQQLGALQDEREVLVSAVGLARQRHVQLRNRIESARRQRRAEFTQREHKAAVRDYEDRMRERYGSNWRPAA